MNSAGARLFFVSRSYPPVRGGMELHNARIHEGLTRYFAMQAIVNRHGKRLLVPFLAVAWLRLLIQLRPGDRVLFGDLLTASLAVWLNPFRRNVVWVSVAHGTDVVWPPRLYQRWVTARILPALSRVIAVSRATARAVQERGANSERVSVIGNGTDGIDWRERRLSRTRLREAFDLELADRPVILTLGRLVPRKGIAWFVTRVVPLLPDDALVLIGGDGPDTERIQEATGRLGLANRVRVLGPVSDDQRATLYNAADIFVMPNQPIPGDMEGFGIALLEAVSVGLPVVGTDMEGIRDAARDGALARLIEPDDPPAFADAVVEELQRVRDRDTRRSDLRKVVLRDCSWQAVAHAYAAVLNDTDASP